VVNLGGIAFSQGQYEDACRWYQQAIQLDAENFNVMNELAVAFLELKQQKEAISWLRRSIEICPDQPTVLSCLNKIETALGLEPTGDTGPGPQPQQAPAADQPRDIGIGDLSGLALSPGPDVQ
jgi:tetratricopeptide (TPR) repeat protein